jgi:hypothetical protein
MTRQGDLHELHELVARGLLVDEVDANQPKAMAVGKD